MFQSQLERTTVVAVDDPRIAANQFSHSLQPIFLRGFRPSRLPVKPVEVFYFDVKQLAQPRRNR